MTMTSRYGLNLIAESQSARVPANEFLLFLEAVKNGKVKSRSTVAQPGSPVDGDLYITTVTPTGAAWTGNGLKYAWRFNGAWRFYAFTYGDIVRVEDENLWVGYNGAAWQGITSVGGLLPAVGPGNQWLFSNGSAWIAAYLPTRCCAMFITQNATAVNTSVNGLASSVLTGLNNTGVGVAAAKTLVGISLTSAIRTGATAGTYTVDIMTVDGAGTENPVQTLTGAANTDLRGYLENTAAGIVAYSGANSMRLGWKNRASSPGALANAFHSVLLDYVVI